MYKAIAIDMDWSLVYEKNKINEENKLALLSYLNRGNKLFIVTGRPVWRAKETLIELGLFLPNVFIAGYNGGEILDVGLNKKIEDKKISVKDTLILNALARQNKVNFLCYFNDKIVSEKIIDFKFKDEAINHLPIFYLKKLNTQNIKPLVKGLVSGDEEDLIRFKKEAERLYGTKFSFTFSQKYYIETMPIEVSKKSAVIKLSKLNNLELEDIIGIGDYYNDIPMLSIVGLPVSLENSIDEIKLMSKYKIKAVQENGLALLINEFFNI